MKTGLVLEGGAKRGIYTARRYGSGIRYLASMYTHALIARCRLNLQPESLQKKLLKLVLITVAESCVWNV